MFIAVCDDNIADRKQTERLLGRQSDRFMKEFGDRLYIDSFGNAEAFMYKPEMYHGLFIDMTSSKENGVEIARMLVEKGITSPIIMCCSSLDYRTLIPAAGIVADNIHYLDKPIKVADLTDIINFIKSSIKTDVPRIELRDNDETLYVSGDDIVCVKEIGRKIRIWLTDGRTLDQLGTAYNFYSQCVKFPQICPVNNSCLVNVNYVKSKGPLHVTMNNGCSFIISFEYRKTINETKAILEAIDTSSH
ncbi:response regulator [Butyrivibrio sp. X503]|uniref:LytR/AlgR family response regulator transcription factor n=1 Tax=Butyrivibrio sp. X503 TaxID=2364878 RepID=UPI000EAA8BA5|nr:response regulator [Butyrivibrio sp. X503]RKM55627.1 response regulator [Butyrivibrio sp. X503]